MNVNRPCAIDHPRIASFVERVVESHVGIPTDARDHESLPVGLGAVGMVEVVDMTRILTFRT